MGQFGVARHRLQVTPSFPVRIPETSVKSGLIGNASDDKIHRSTINYLLTLAIGDASQPNARRLTTKLFPQ